MSDWAEDKAREWLERSGGHLEGGEPCIPLEYGWVPIADYSIASLAALLREVAGPCKSCDKDRREFVQGYKADVRRVVEEYAEELRSLAMDFAPDDKGDPRSYYQREAAGARGVLTLLEKLK